MRLASRVPVLVLAAFDLAIAKSTLHARDSCGQWDSFSAGPYTIYQNLWGEASATSGWQCSGLDYVSGNAISWHTVWDWQGGPGSVKSYANAELKFSERQLGSISSIPTTWQWR